jgi:hypothetical protein
VDHVPKALEKEMHEVPLIHMISARSL